MLVMIGSMKGFHLSSHATFQISTEISIHQLNVGIQLLDTIRKHLNRGGCLGRYGSIGPFVVFFPVTSSTEDLM